MEPHFPGAIKSGTLPPVRPSSYHFLQTISHTRKPQTLTLSLLCSSSTMGSKSSKSPRSDHLEPSLNITNHISAPPQPPPLIQPHVRAIESHPDFHPPYPHPSRAPIAKYNTNLAYSMSEIREASGYHHEKDQQRYIQDEMERMRIEAYGAAAARSPSLRYSQQRQQRQQRPVARYNSTPTFASLPATASMSVPSHNQAMAMIRESSGAYL
ncbi:hypothetical protein EDD21DRAFT_436055 [Dissophora ornata]|nr:hypothetical protein EDD21DRAFT_436055 [Dissophora ornata]